MAAATCSAIRRTDMVTSAVGTPALAQLGEQLAAPGRQGTSLSRLR